MRNLVPKILEFFGLCRVLLCEIKSRGFIAFWDVRVGFADEGRFSCRLTCVFLAGRGPRNSQPSGEALDLANTNDSLSESRHPVTGSRMISSRFNPVGDERIAVGGMLDSSSGTDPVWLIDPSVEFDIISYNIYMVY